MSELISVVAAEFLRFEGLTLDIGGRALLDADGRDLGLTRSEFELLAALVRSPGRALSRERLLEAVSGRRGEPFDRSIDMLVSRLRRKIEPDAKAPRLILAVPGIGYKFAAKASPVAEPNFPNDSPTDAQTATPKPRPPERRQLTVLRCAMAGSSALATALDPEDLSEAVAAFHACCAEIIGRFGGVIARSGDDGVLAWFGYPEADELDAERAIRAALAVIAAVPQIKTGFAEPIHARIGLGTGLVVIGDPAEHEHPVIGEAPSMAAALLSLAAPDMILISTNTRRLVGELFAMRPLAPVTFEGFADRIAAWQVVGESCGASRFGALRGRRVTQLVGRDEELALLMHRWEQAQAGSGRVVLIVGEPGIGKSRLLRAFEDRLAGAMPLRIAQYCSPHYKDSPLYPVIAHLMWAAGFARADSPAERLAKLQGLLARTAANEEQIRLIASLLGIANGAHDARSEMTAQKRKEKVMAALLAQLRALSARQPVLMIYEDLHWIDPTSLELLSLRIEQIARAPVLVIATARPEFRPPWAEEAYVTTLALGRLDQRDAATLVANVAGDAKLPEDEVARILAHTDGVPLFIEEMTRAVLETPAANGDRHGNGSNGNGTGGAATSVPASLQSLLLARLDRLGPAREVAQLGAVIGREFGYELLAAVAERPEDELQAALDRLAEAGLVFRYGSPPDARFQFKHALMHDAACGTLLRGQLQTLHARVAGVLESRFPEIVRTRPEAVAHHFTEAGLAERAVEYWLNAGQQALSRSAMIEAEALLRRGLTLVSSLPDSVWRREQEFDLQVALGRALIATRGFGAVEVGEAYVRARQLWCQLNRPRNLLPILLGQFLHLQLLADLESAQQLAAEIRQLGETDGDVVARAIGYRANGFLSLNRGDFAAGRADVERALALYDPVHRHAYMELFPVDGLVSMLGLHALALVCCGYLDQARSERDTMLAEARRLSHAHTLCQALWSAWTAGMFARAEPAELLRYANEALALATERGFAFWRAWAQMARGWCLAALGDADEGISVLTTGLASIDVTGCILGRPIALTRLADACRLAGQPQVGLSHLGEAQRLAKATQERWVEAEMLRLQGDLLILADDDGAAEASFRKAVALAGRQGGRLWELRAATSLARLWGEQGRLAEARDLLEPIHGWFTEGFDAADLNEARTLLAELK